MFGCFWPLASRGWLSIDRRKSKVLFSRGSSTAAVQYECSRDRRFLTVAVSEIPRALKSVNATKTKQIPLNEFNSRKLNQIYLISNKFKQIQTKSIKLNLIQANQIKLI